VSSPHLLEAVVSEPPTSGASLAKTARTVIIRGRYDIAGVRALCEFLNNFRAGRAWRAWRASYWSY
jgi:hypothetical protein